MRYIYSEILIVEETSDTPATRDTVPKKKITESNVARRREATENHVAEFSFRTSTMTLLIWNEALSLTNGAAASSQRTAKATSRKKLMAGIPTR